MRSFLSKLLQRPWPTSIDQMRNLQISYSQFGEDLLLTHLLGYKKANGFYIDVGCFKPIQFSNTFIFYQRGWSGIATDANPAFEPLWKKVRPRDKFINSGVSTEAGKLEYLQFDNYPACNQLRIPGEQSQFHLELPPDRVTLIDTKPLSTILKAMVPANKRIDFMSIDCEGLDEVVLKSNDFALHRPSVLLIEDHARSFSSPVHQFCEQNGYRLHSLCALTKIFVDGAIWDVICCEKQLE